jgi:hypothetical protein
MVTGMDSVITPPFVHTHHSKERMLPASLDAEFPSRRNQLPVHLFGRLQKAGRNRRTILRGELAGAKSANRGDAIRHIAQADRLHPQ